MPTYSILKNVHLNSKPAEQVGAGFNTELVHGLLRGKYHFNGVVLSDWTITADCDELCQHGMPPGKRPGSGQIGMSWGVESLSRDDRVAKAVNAGVDQLGGLDEPQPLLQAVRDGKVSEVRVREAARRILLQKFELGLFENPYVDAQQASTVVGGPAFVSAGVRAQERDGAAAKPRSSLPLRPSLKLYLFGIEPTVAQAHGYTVVATPTEADVAVLRASTPFEMLHPNFFFGSIQHEGRLNFRAGDPAYDALLACGKTPVVMTISLDRPAILTNVRDKAAALLANFGIGDDALLDVLTGKAHPEGTLPFELPSSMSAVEAQDSGAPHDSKAPLFAYGFGLRY